jgi:hypothetical protein
MAKKKGKRTKNDRRVALVEQELLTLLEHLSSPPGSCYSIFSFMCNVLLRAKGQKTIYKTLHIKLKIEYHEPH